MTFNLPLCSTRLKTLLVELLTSTVKNMAKSAYPDKERKYAGEFSTMLSSHIIFIAWAQNHIPYNIVFLYNNNEGFSYTCTANEIAWNVSCPFWIRWSANKIAENGIVNLQLEYILFAISNHILKSVRNTFDNKFLMIFQFLFSIL